MLWGPDDFDSENDPIILATSSGVVGERKSEFGFLCLRKFEKWWLVLGIEDLTVSATDEKKSLNLLDTVTGFDETELPTDI